VCPMCRVWPPSRPPGTHKSPPPPSTGTVCERVRKSDTDQREFTQILGLFPSLSVCIRENPCPIDLAKPYFDALAQEDVEKRLRKSITCRGRA